MATANIARAQVHFASRTVVDASVQWRATHFGDICPQFKRSLLQHLSLTTIDAVAQLCIRQPKDSSLYVSPGHMYVHGSSPVRPHLDEAAAAVAALAAASTLVPVPVPVPRPAARWIVGGPGTGKSQLLRLIAMLPNLVTSNVVGVYMDAAACEPRLTVPLVALKDALGCRAWHYELESPVDFVFPSTQARLALGRVSVAEDTDIPALLHAARDCGLGVVLCVDSVDAQSLWHSVAWKQVQAVLGHCNAHVVVAGRKTLCGPTDQFFHVALDPLTTPRQYFEFQQCQEGWEGWEGDAIPRVLATTDGSFRELCRQLKADPSARTQGDFAAMKRILPEVK